MEIFKELTKKVPIAVFRKLKSARIIINLFTIHGIPTCWTMKFILLPFGRMETMELMITECYLVNPGWFCYHIWIKTLVTLNRLTSWTETSVRPEYAEPCWTMMWPECIYFSSMPKMFLIALIRTVLRKFS